jgi:hypothetical protein
MAQIGAPAPRYALAALAYLSRRLPMMVTTPSLSISPEKVCFFVVKAREFDVKDVVTDPNSGSNPSDDAMIYGVL